MGRFLGRTIAVTGAGSGLGLATANLLSSEGANVVGLDIAFSPELTDSVLRVPVDVRDLDGLVAAYTRGRDMFGAFDGLATFAGIEMPGRIDAISPDDWRRVLDINVVGSANAVQALLPDLRQSRLSAILLCSSQLSLAGGRNCVAYAASKGAINSMCKSLAVDHAADGIRVNAVAPGATDTPMMTRAFADLSLIAQQAAMNRHALGRFGKPQETAMAAAFLLGEQASFITGVVLPVDGGWCAA